MCMRCVYPLQCMYVYLGNGLPVTSSPNVFSLTSSHPWARCRHPYLLLAPHMYLNPRHLSAKKKRAASLKELGLIPDVRSIFVIYSPTPEDFKPRMRCLNLDRE